MSPGQNEKTSPAIQVPAGLDYKPGTRTGTGQGRTRLAVFSTNMIRRVIKPKGVEQETVV